MPIWLLKDGASLPADIKFTSFQEYLEDQMAAATATGTEAAE